MKTSKNNNVATKVSTKKGAASLYVVIFTTLLLGVITLSFIRIVLSETTQTSNTDLSQSAYDSALAGVEDAKVALLRYHDCLSGRSASSNCDKIISAMQTGIETQSCDVVRDTLGRAANDAEGKSEVLIQESSTKKDSGSNNSTSLLQAYTCIKIAEELEDYRSTLSNNFRTRIIPLRTKYIDKVKYITIEWYSDTNNVKQTNITKPKDLNFMTNTDKRFDFYAKDNTKPPYSPPVVSAEFIQASSSFTPNEDFNVPNGSNTNRAEAILYPVESGGIDSNRIKATTFAKTGNKMIDDSGTGSKSNRLFKITCDGFDNGKEFACKTRIDLPRPINDTGRSDNATFLRLTLPYGDLNTDFAVRMRGDIDGDGNYEWIDFEGVQADVDSTGRANDLYRRIESRVELVDVYYPYPEFAIQADGGTEEDAILKDYYATWNCWRSDDGATSRCNDNDKTDK